MNNNPHPTAVVKKRRRWILPITIVVAAAILAAVLISSHLVKRGLVVHLTMSDGYGIKAGNTVRCRGIEVGVVERVRISDTLDGVEIDVRLEPSAKALARAGTLWWVVRPRFGLSGVGGLETLAGPRYIQVVPGDGTRQTMFAMLEEAPPVTWLDPAGLEITLNSPQRGSLSAGAPVIYRQHRIGTVLSVELAQDATSSEVRAYVEPEYVTLIRDNSRFWEVSGLAFHFGLTSFRMELESLRALVDGGIAVATPDLPGAAVSTGHRFDLAPRVEDEWLEWRPPLAVGTTDLPGDAIVPRQFRGKVSWKTKWLRRKGQRASWLLPTAAGLWGPKELLSPGEPEAVLTIEGEAIALTAENVKEQGKLALLLSYTTTERVLPSDALRALAEPEECVVFLGPGVSPIKLDPGKLRSHRTGWEVDPTVPFSHDMHQGAVVVASADGKAVGMLIVDDGEAFVAPLKLPQ
ncbi:MAG: MlaD family protein [Planctomycetota bacterium]